MRLPPPRRLAAVLGAALLGAAVLGAALLLSSCPRAGIMPFGVEVSGGEGGSPVFSLVKAPTFNVSDSATLFSPTTLTLSTETPDADIYYTTVPGAEPDIPYPAEGIPLDGDVTIRAQTIRNQLAKSSIIERNYAFKVPNPDFDPPVQPGTPTNVTITAISGAVIHVSDLNPAQMAPVLENPYIFLGLAANKNLYVQVFKTNWSPSEQLVY